MSKFTLAHLQGRQEKWLDSWAPEATAWQQLLGACEEYGEACAAMGDRDAYLDAIADCCIFLAGFFNRSHLDLYTSGLDLYTCWCQRAGIELPPRPWPELLLGKVCHHYLKLEQGIRGTPDDRRAIQDAVSGLLKYWELECSRMGVDFLKLVESVWDKVEKRDWNAERKARES
jgi:hypothetical protein